MMEDVHLQGKQRQVQGLCEEIEGLGGVLLTVLGSLFPSTFGDLQLD